MHAALTSQYEHERDVYWFEHKKEAPGPAQLYGYEFYKKWQKAVHKELSRNKDNRCVCGCAQQYSHYFVHMVQHSTVWYLQELIDMPTAKHHQGPHGRRGIQPVFECIHGEINRNHSLH